MNRDANNYDLLRLILALAVIFGHIGALSPPPGFSDPVIRLIGFDYSRGLAVKVFFFLSGLFVTDSIVISRSALRFAVMRVTRLFPGLLVCLMVSTFVVGPFYTGLPIVDYLRNPLTLSYIGANLALTDLQWRLPGVFAHSQFGVNGSLWTIPIEIRLYVVVLLLHCLGVFARRSSASLALGLVGYFVLKHADLAFGGPAAQGLVLCFLTGMATAVHKRYMPLHGLIMLAAALCTLALWRTPCGHAVFYCALFYACLYIFQLRIITRIHLPGDFSYGVYLYGFVVQQCLLGVIPRASPLFNGVVCMCIATGIAILSWFLVERPALLTARRILRTHAVDAHSIRVVATWSSVAMLCLILPRVLPLLAGSSPVISDDLLVVSYGPVPVSHGVAFNIGPDGSSAIWVRLSRPVTPDAQIRLGTNLLTSVVSGDLVTASVPGWIFAEPGSLKLFVVEPIEGRLFTSPAVPWEVR